MPFEFLATRFEDFPTLLNVMKVLALAAIAFLVAMSWTPLWTNILYKKKLGVSIRKSARTPIYTKMHQKKEGTPTMGGVLIWVTTLVLALFFWVLAVGFEENPLWQLMNFLSRSQTLLPLGALVATALVGLVDDLFNVKKIGPLGGGLSLKQRIVLYTVVASFGAYWFFVKLGWDIIHVPGFGDYEIGWWYIPLFIFVIVATAFSVNEADGLDGLAGGILMFCFGAYSVIAFSQGRVDLAAFCAVISGSLLAFLWFNVYPARFFMGDTGAMSLGVTLGIVAMLTNSVLVLPIIAFPLVVESMSVIIQVFSKKVFGRKVFLSAPIHHHFEAKGWPEAKVTMRFWIVAAISASVGLVVGLVGMG